MDICEVVPVLGVGGVESFVLELSREFARQGHRVTVVSLFRPPVLEVAERLGAQLVDAGIEVRSLGCRFRDIASSALGLRRLLRELPVQVLHLHLRYPAMAGSLAMLGNKVCPVVETYHSHYRFYAMTTRFTRLLVDRYVAVSHQSAGELITRFGLPSEKCTVIHNGIDVDSLRARRATYHGEAPGRLRLLAAGRFTEQKGFGYLLEALTVIEPNIRDEISLTLIGDGPLRRALEVQARRLRNVVDIIPVLPRDEFLELMRTHDVVVMPSVFEGLSVLALEGLALSKPFIVSDIASFRETFDFGPLPEDATYKEIDVGLAVRPRCSQALAEAVQFISANRQHLSRYSEASCRTAEHYRISRVASDYIELFEGLTSAHSGAPH